PCLPFLPSATARAANLRGTRLQPAEPPPAVGPEEVAKQAAAQPERSRRPGVTQRAPYPVERAQEPRCPRGLRPRQAAARPARAASAEYLSWDRRWPDPVCAHDPCRGCACAARY